MPGSASELELELLTRYTAWANQRLYACIANLPATQLTAPSLIFAGSLLRTLNHVRVIDVVWQSHLLGVPHGFTTRNPDTTPTFEALRREQATLDAWFVDYADALDPAKADEVVHFAFIGGGDGVLTRAEIVAHVVNHTTYHRGHLTAQLNTLGVQPPVTDLPVFVRESGSR